MIGGSTLWHHRSEPSTYDDHWEDQPGQGPFHQWGLGVVGPLAIACCGGPAGPTRHVEFGARIALTRSGVSAVAVGVAWCSAAAFVHCHYCCGNVYD